MMRTKTSQNITKSKRETKNFRALTGQSLGDLAGKCPSIVDLT